MKLKGLTSLFKFFRAETYFYLFIESFSPLSHLEVKLKMNKSEQRSAWKPSNLIDTFQQNVMD